MSKKPKSTDEHNPAGQIPGDLEIDLGAALPIPAPKSKRGRGRPRSTNPTTPKPRKYKVRKDKGIKKGPKIKGENQSHYIDNNILVDNKIIKEDDIDYSDKEDLQTAKDLKGKMTPKELYFLGLYLAGNISKIKAIKSAGFKAAHDSYLYLLAKKILEKYESQAGDHRIIARALGAGEVFIIKTLYLLAKDSKSEKIRGENAMNLAKILGLAKDQIEGAGGLTIIFEGADQRQVHMTGQAPPSAGSPALEQPGPAITYTRPLQITK